MKIISDIQNPNSSMDTLPRGGWLNIYKPQGISSASVVGFVKRFAYDIFGKKAKVGHAGTLDLEAEGVLPIAIGEATKLVQFLMDARKTYKFIIKFGSMTDTGDAAGKVIKDCSNESSAIPARSDCESICKDFLGKITQIPPKFSALKINGVPAYKLAREGIAPEMKPREVEIFHLECNGYNNEGFAEYIAEVSKGTYIRTLAEDIAHVLGTLGHVVKLVRTRVGCFDEKESVDIQNIISNKIPRNDLFHKINIFSPEIVLADMPKIKVNASLAHDVRCGKKVVLDHEDCQYIWLEHEEDSCQKIVAVGGIVNNIFKSTRVFGL